MSLRTRLLAAFAYVLVLVIVALEVPLTLNVSRRVDAEVKAQAAAEAQLVAASASGRMNDQGELRALADEAAAELGGRVIVVDQAGRLQADSAGLESGSYRDRPEIRTALVEGRSASRSSLPLSRSSAASDASAPCGSRRASAPSTGGYGVTFSASSASG